MGLPLCHRWVTRFCAACAIMVVAEVSLAQGNDPDPREANAPHLSQKRSWGSRLAPASSQRLFRSADPEERLRGVQLLAGQNDYNSIQILVQAIQSDPRLASDPRFRIEAIRALAPFAAKPSVGRQLLAWIADPSPQERMGSLGQLASEQAAMALAASSDHTSIAQLVFAIIEGDGPGKRAANALAAHPPRNLDALLRPSALENPKIVELIGTLGDLRAIPKLRKLLVDADIEVKVAAAISLAKLGDASGVRLASDWIAQDGSTPRLRIGAAQTLSATRSPLAPRAIAILLADPATRDAGLQLAHSAPSPQLTPTLAGLLEVVDEPTRGRVLVSLARSGGPLAVATLSSLINANKSDFDAAFALAFCRDPEADTVLDKLLSNPETRHLGARASLLRRAELGRMPGGLPDTLKTLASSRDDTDRSIGAFGLVFLGYASVDAFAHDKTASMAACHASLALPPENRKVCENQLVTTQDPDLRDALAGALSHPSLAGVSTEKLLSWAEEPRVSAPVFCRILGHRDAPMYRSRIKRLLASGDAHIRSQVALGLANSPQDSATSLLVGAYAHEADPMVRRAIVIGLASRKSALARPWLELAVQLDPDEQVRSLARHGLAGRRLVPQSRGSRLLWLQLVPSQPEFKGPRAVSLVSSTGFATVAMSAPDGQILVPNMSSGSIQVRINTFLTRVRVEN